jgi:hypothetical protein
LVGPKKAIFEEASPRFKQMLMYMAGISDEDEFHRISQREGSVGWRSTSLSRTGSVMSTTGGTPPT